MHELAITKSIVRLILDESKQKGIIPKEAVVELGLLTSYKKDAVLYYYSILRKETPLLSGTSLDVKEVSGEMRCNDCQRNSTVTEPLMLSCPHCSSGDVSIIKGKECTLKSIKGV